MSSFLTTSIKVVRECAEAMVSRRETTQTYETKVGQHTAKGRVTSIREIDRMLNGTPIWEITVAEEEHMRKSGVVKRAMKIVLGGRL